MSRALPVLEETPYAKLTSKQGQEILRRIQIAMSESEYVKVDPNLIRPMKGQPRDDPKSKRIESLSQSMREAGQIMPGIIRAIKPDATGNTYELLDGERRWHAVREAGIAFYRAMQVKIDDNAAPYVVSVISNFNRESHTTLEVLDSIIKMHEMLGLTHGEIAKTLGFSYASVTNFYGMRKLVPLVRDMLDPNLMPRKKTLPVSAAMQIARLPALSQFPLASRVMRGEVKMVSLRTEIVSAAKKAGVEINEPFVSARILRRRMDNRVRLFATQAATLEKTFTMAGLPKVLQGFSVDMLLSLEKSLEESKQHIDTVLRFLVEARGNNRVLIKRQ